MAKRPVNQPLRRLNLMLAYSRGVGDTATAMGPAANTKTNGAQRTLTAVRGHVFTTPGYLQLAQLVLGVFSVLLVAVTGINVNRQQTLARSYASTSASSVLTAQRLKDAAAGMDAFAAKALATKSPVFTSTLGAREAKRKQVVDDLLADRKPAMLISKSDAKRWRNVSCSQPRIWWAKTVVPPNNETYLPCNSLPWTTSRNCNRLKTCRWPETARPQPRRTTRRSA